MPVVPLKVQQARSRANQFRSRLAVSIFMVNLIAYALVIWMLVQSRQEYESHASATIQNIAKLLRHSIADTLRNREAALLAAQTGIESRLSSSHAPQGDFKNLLAHMHTLNNLQVVDNQGNWLHKDRHMVEPSSPLSAQQHFRFLRDNPHAGLLITRQSRASQVDEFLVLSRRYNHPDGSFAGIVFSKVALNHFESLFASPDIGPNGTVILWSQDAGTLVRHPIASPLGSSVIADNVAEWRLPDFSVRDSWLLASHTYADGVERKTAVHQVPGFPIYVVAGLATDDYLTKWWQSVTTASDTLLLFTLMTVLLSFALYHGRFERMLAASSGPSVRLRPCQFKHFRRRSSLPAISLLRSHLPRMPIPDDRLLWDEFSPESASS